MLRLSSATQCDAAASHKAYAGALNRKGRDLRYRVKGMNTERFMLFSRRPEVARDRGWPQTRLRVAAVPIDDEQGEKLLRLVETLEENDDVQNVYANFEVSDALVSKMT
jgi:hypothetical protein